MALTLQDLPIPTDTGPARPDPRGGTTPADAASDPFAALFDSAASKPTTPASISSPQSDVPAKAGAAHRQHSADRTSSSGMQTDTAGSKDSSTARKKSPDRADGKAAAIAEPVQHRHKSAADASAASGTPAQTTASNDRVTSDITTDQTVSLFQVTLLATQPEPTPSEPFVAANVSASTVTLPAVTSLTVIAPAVAAPAIGASVAEAPVVGAPVAAEPAAASTSVSPAAPTTGPAAADIAALFGKNLSPAPQSSTADATQPASTPQSNRAESAAPQAIAPATPARSPSDIAVVAVTIAATVGAQVQLASATVLPRAVDGRTVRTDPKIASEPAVAASSATATLADRVHSFAEDQTKTAVEPDRPVSAKSDAAQLPPSSTAPPVAVPPGPDGSAQFVVPPDNAGGTNDNSQTIAAPQGADPYAANGIVPSPPVANAQQAQAAYAATGDRSDALPQITLDQVAMRLAKATGDGLDRLTIHLKPAELGAIEVKLEMGDGGISKATISADRQDTLNLLQNDSHRLERALENAGIKADAGSLAFNLRGDGGRYTPNFAQGGYQQTPSSTRSGAAESLLPDTATVIGIINARAALGGIDIRV
jgi:flagellar hook-length control protein FliK